MNNEKIKTIGMCFIVLLWAICIYLLSGMSNSTTTSKSILNKVVTVYDNVAVKIKVKDKLWTEKEKIKIVVKLNYPCRKIMHVSEYFILCLLMVHLLKLFPVKHKYLYAFLFCVCYAITDEYHQTFINGRTGQLLDVFIDSIGPLLCILILNGKNWFKKKDL